MANHKSSEKRARQTVGRRQRNGIKKSRVQTASRKVREAKDSTEVSKALSEAFSVLQKARGALHKKTIKRKMSRLAKAAELLKKAS